MDRPTDIVLESGARHDFIDELLSVPGGERLNECIQCGTCSGSCPVSYYMDNPPRKLFAMIRAGLRDRVLQSASLWLCTSCYVCTIRCPKQIAVTDIIYALKRLAMSEGKLSGAVKAATLANSFVGVVDDRGRNFEPELLVRYYARTNPLGLLKKVPLGMKLLVRGRMPVRGERIEGRDQIRTIIARSREIGGP
jgi:heterodisulfide reductase subunit C